MTPPARHSAFGFAQRQRASLRRSTRSLFLALSSNTFASTQCRVEKTMPTGKRKMNTASAIVSPQQRLAPYFGITPRRPGFEGALGAAFSFRPARVSSSHRTSLSFSNRATSFSRNFARRPSSFRLKGRRTISHSNDQHAIFILPPHILAARCYTSAHSRQRRPVPQAADGGAAFSSL